MILPHPVGQLPREQMERLTDEHADDMAFILSARREELAQRFTRKRD